MALFRCGGGSGSAPVIVERGIELIEDNTTSGSSTYTITADGTYLIIASVSYQGSRSIALPQDRTATINQSVEVSGGQRGMTVVIADLQVDDVVTMSATPSSWNAFSKQIYKLNNITASSVADTDAANDTTKSFSISSTGNYLVVGLCFGLNSANYRDDTVYSFSKAFKGMSNKVGVNTITKVIADDATNIPELTLYGYDGGGAFYIAISIS